MRVFAFKIKPYINLYYSFFTAVLLLFCFSSCIHDNEQVINTSPLDSLKDVPGGIAYMSFPSLNDTQTIWCSGLGYDHGLDYNTEDILSDVAYTRLNKYINYTNSRLILLSENKKVMIIFPYEKNGRAEQTDGYIFSSQKYTDQQMIELANSLMSPRYYPVEQYRRISDQWMRFTSIGNRNDEYFGLFDE
ncbi:MAG: hypothetical protein ACK5Z2_14160 [Bacteroidota bacterium]|jgi:hypothetical protein